MAPNHFTYDSEGRTTAWQNAPNSPTSTEQMAYDGEGNRVALQVTGGTPTYYLGQLEEISGTTVTKYFTLGGAGLPLAERVGTNGVTYPATDGLDSVSLFVRHQPVPFTPLRCRSRT